MLYWWNNITVGVPIKNLTWAKFNMRFEERFISEISKSSLLRKFAKLVQGDMCWGTIRFKELSEYGYAMMDTVIKRNKKFIHGLRLKLAGATLPNLRDPCDVVVEMALRNE